jgi:hypothetical protein
VSSRRFPFRVRHCQFEKVVIQCIQLIQTRTANDRQGLSMEITIVDNEKMPFDLTPLPHGYGYRPNDISS